MLPAFALLFALQASVTPAAMEVLAEVRVHGNHTTPTDTILALSGLQVGGAADEATLAAAAAALRGSGRFAAVEMRKRFRSIADPSSVLVVIVIDERASAGRDLKLPRALTWVNWLAGSGMWLPILKFEEGYGWTYGARFTFVDAAGPRSRISVPATWGATREATAEAEWALSRGPLSRVLGGAGLRRREHPFYGVVQSEQEVRVRGERVLRPWLRSGGAVETSRVEFAEAPTRQWQAGADLTVDTRRDPVYPRNAVYLAGGWRQLQLDGESTARLSNTNAAYLGAVGTSVVALRTSIEVTNRALPPWEQPILGGGSQLRGYRYGYRVGDQMASASAELRVPLTSPLGIGRLGVKTFIDAGTTWAHGTSVGATRWDHGIGAGVFLNAAVFSVNLDVAWPERGGPRFHGGLGIRLP